MPDAELVFARRKRDTVNDKAKGSFIFFLSIQQQQAPRGG
jgi:hypothetical protein